jgi:hypothetical protein
MLMILIYSLLSSLSLFFSLLLGFFLLFGDPLSLLLGDSDDFEPLGFRVYLSDLHELHDLLIGDLFATLLELLSEVSEALDQDFFDLIHFHLSCRVLLTNLFQLDIVFKEEAQVLVGHVNIKIGCPVLSYTGEGIESDFAADVLWGVRQQDRGVRITTRHLGLESLQSWEKD